jgi:hypothetical protein
MPDRARGAHYGELICIRQSAEIAGTAADKTASDKASPGGAVMLHLRSCYVSKARDFNGFGTARAHRKSKSRLNSKGLDREAPRLATVFPLRV